VPYSKSTTKQNVKNAKRTNQKRPRSNPMAQMVTYSPAEVNGGERRAKLPIEGQGEAAIVSQPCACPCSI
jgi:hypothetical protein